MKAELEQLESIERPKITQQIAEARDKGDFLKMQNMMLQKKHKEF
jgi:transcription elongation GreA/GreB family factor